MHVVFASTRIRAALYAAALGLSDEEWQHPSGTTAADSAAWIHVLPYTSPTVADTLRRNHAGGAYSATLVDLSAVT